MAFKPLDLSGQAQSRVFGLIAGTPGIGKTTQVSTFPNREVLFVGIEDGHLSIQGSGIDAVKVESCDELIELFEAAATWKHKYLFIDSLSEVYDMIKREARDKFTASQNFQKFDYVNMKFLGIIKEAKSLADKTIFFTCHTKEEKNGVVLESELAFDGKLPGEIKKQFDLIIHMDKKKDDDGNEHRVFVTDPTISKIAKARVSPFMGVEINAIEEADLYELTKKLKGEK